jgi:hypothetical protein
MPKLIVNGAGLPMRLVEVELSKLKLDAENPRLHSAYLTHELPADPTQKQIEAVLRSLPEFQPLVESILRNDGCFAPPLVSADFRVLEGNRRVAALRSLRAQQPKSGKWTRVTVHQLASPVLPTQEKTIRAKFHLEGMLPWDGLSQVAEYTALAEREGPDYIGDLLGRPARQIEPLLVAGRCLRAFSIQYPAVRSRDVLWVLVGLCGVRQLEPEVKFSRSTRSILTDQEEDRPPDQPFPIANFYKWLAEGRFTRPYEEEGRVWSIKPGQAPMIFRRVRQAGEEALLYFIEEGDSLAKAIASLECAQPTPSRQMAHALSVTRKYIEVLNQMKAIRKEDSPDLHRDAMACYHRLEQLLGITRKERARVHSARH